MRHLPFWEAVAALVGTIIGSGVFVLPYAASRAGIGLGLVWLLILGLVVIYIHLLLGEVVLRTNKEYRLPGYVGYYLGQPAKRFLLVTNFLTFSISLVIYLILGAKFLATLLQPYHISENHLVLGLWFLLTIIVLFGSKAVGRINFYFSFALLGLFLLIFIYCLPHINYQNFQWLNTSGSWAFWLLPYGIYLYALIGNSAVPEAIKMMRDKVSSVYIKKAIILGSILPVIVYVLFIFSVVGTTGLNTSVEAISGLTNVLGIKIIILGALLGFLAVATSYLIFGSYLKHSFIYDYGWSKYFAAFLIALGPIIFYFLGIGDFIKWISFIGALLIGFEALMILYTNRQAKLKPDRLPEYTIPLPKLIFAIIAICFIIGALMQVSLLS